MRSTLKERRGFPYQRRWASSLVGGDVLPVTFPTSFLTTRVYIALGADLTASYLTWNWLDVTDRVRHDLGITVTVGRQDRRERVTASRCTIKLSNTDGYLCRRNPMSPYWGLLTKNTPIWIQIDPGSGYVDRYFGYVNEWPASWSDASGSDSFVTVQCSGVMRRLERGQVLKSALYRSITGAATDGGTLLAYWSLEDSSDAQRFASALPGGTTATFTQPVLANDGTLPGSQPLPTVPASNVLTFFGTVNRTPGAGSPLTFELWAKPSSDPSSKLDIYLDMADGTRWNVYLSGQAFVDFHLSGSFVNITMSGFLTADTWHNLRLTLTQNGADIDVKLMVDGTLAGTGTRSATTLASPVSVTTPPTFTSDISFGHIHVWSGIPASFYQAGLGYPGEQAHERIRRLCAEEGVPLATQAANSAAMGPQPVRKLLDLLRECETADLGVLSEHQFGLAYQALNERYNQPVSLSLDFDSGHHAGIPEPRDDDSRLVNKFTASRRNGSSATAEITSGTLGTGPGGSGVYDDSGTINVETDDQLSDYAWWSVHLGTVDEDQWPRLPFQLHRNPGLILSWLATTLGARINAAHPPAQMNPDTIDAIIEGYTERWVQEAWDVAVFTSPASPYTVAEVDAATRVTAEGSTLAVAIADSDMSFSLASTAANGVWSTDAADYPLDVDVGGERITLSGISGASSPQTATVATNGRSVNGVVKSHSSGAAVDVWEPAVVAL